MGGKRLVLETDALGNRVGGIARRSGAKTVFVRGALPGERVACRPVREKRSYVEAELLEVLQPSPHRREPDCREYGWCGGCSLQHLDYGRQLHWKRRWVESALRRQGIPGPAPEATVPSPLVLGYRNRVTFEVADGRPGLHAFRGDPRPVGGCPLLPAEGNALVRILAGSGALGGCSRAAVRCSTGMRSLRVEVYGADGRPELGLPEDVGLAWQTGGSWHSEGPELRERLGGMELPVPPGGFLQVNTAAAEGMVGRVTDLCGPGPVLDLYAGVGTFGLALAAQGRKVHCAERNAAAVECARRAAEEQGAGDITFEAGRARGCLLREVRRGAVYDTVVADPPRSGMGVRAARLLRRLDARRLVMVGCDPFAMARDLKVLVEGGYGVRRVLPVDLFPQTDHVETVVLLDRRNGAAGRVNTREEVCNG
jgi:23S rRNA (uracil1939-C5)-methyltransferase